MCGAEALLIAVTLAKDFAMPTHTTLGGTTAVTLECTPIACGGTAVEIARWQLLKAEAAEKAERAYNAKVKEFQDIIRMCGIGEKP